MADFLKQTAKENGIPRGAAAVVLPGSAVFTRLCELPPMTDAQLAYNLPFEFKDYLREEKGQYVFDYSVQELVPSTPERHVCARCGCLPARRCGLPLSATAPCCTARASG